jgi:hypothetical protein
MEVENESEMLVALFGALAAAEATLHDLQDAGVPYPDIRMGAHPTAELDRAIVEQLKLDGSASEQIWSLAVTLDEKWYDKALEVLRGHAPLAIGRVPASDNRRDDTERGAIAWRHYVFESPAATDAVGEYAGTTGTTGIVGSGVFAAGALAEGNPPTKATPPNDERPSDADTPPTSDTLTPVTSTERSRPQTELN